MVVRLCLFLVFLAAASIAAAQEPAVPKPYEDWLLTRPEWDHARQFMPLSASQNPHSGQLDFTMGHQPVDCLAPEFLNSEEIFKLTETFGRLPDMPCQTMKRQSFRAADRKSFFAHILNQEVSIAAVSSSPSQLAEFMGLYAPGTDYSVDGFAFTYDGGTIYTIQFEEGITLQSIDLAFNEITGINLIAVSAGNTGGLGSSNNSENNQMLSCDIAKRTFECGGDSAAPNDSCLNSAVGFLDYPGTYPLEEYPLLEVNSERHAKFRARIEASGVVIDSQGEVALSAGHVDKGRLFAEVGEPDFAANIWRPSGDIRFPFASVKGSVKLETVDIFVVHLEWSGQADLIPNHPMLRLTPGQSIDQSPFLLNAGYGYRPTCSDNSGTERGIKRFTPIKPSTGKRPLTFLADSLAVAQQPTYVCSVDSGSPAYALLTDYRRAVVGILSRTLRSQGLCRKRSEFIDVTDPAVQVSILDAAAGLLGMTTDAERRELEKRLFVDGVLFNGTFQEVIAAWGQVPSDETILGALPSSKE